MQIISVVHEYFLRFTFNKTLEWNPLIPFITEILGKPTRF